MPNVEPITFLKNTNIAEHNALLNKINELVESNNLILAKLNELIEQFNINVTHVGNDSEIVTNTAPIEVEELAE